MKEKRQKCKEQLHAMCQWRGNKCIHNQKLVHTAEVYLTVRSPKEIIKSNRKAKIVSGESGHGSDLTIPADKYHRDTYYVSVHTRNLAIPSVQSTSSVGSLGVGQGYNQWKKTKKDLRFHYQ